MPREAVLTRSMDHRTWHILQISAALDEEFASALSGYVPVIGWKPEPRLLSGWMHLPARQPPTRCSPNFQIHGFGRMPGYARPLLSTLARVGPSVCRAIQAHAEWSENDVLVCTTPYMAPVAECWPGPVVYWLTDRIADYTSAKHINVRALDRRMCAAADLVCPNSERLREYMMLDAGCAPSKICVLPNAVRASNLLPEPLFTPSALPAMSCNAERPVAGVLGNMGSNLDWPLLLEAVQRTPWLKWLFVGPVKQDVHDPAHRKARAAVQRCQNACFTGAKPYGELVHYARGIDVAILPYFRREPTYSGSSTRFYEHLAACRPMLASRGFAELLHKEPLIQLFTGAMELVVALEVLRDSNFSDGAEELRWRESYCNTWQVRAQTMQSGLDAQLESTAAAYAVAV